LIDLQTVSWNQRVSNLHVNLTTNNREGCVATVSILKLIFYAAFGMGGLGGGDWVQDFADAFRTDDNSTRWAFVTYCLR